jgi:hypothetical protein
VYDRRGRPVLVYGFRQYSIVTFDNNLQRFQDITENQAFQLVDGPIWSPVMLRGDNPHLIGVCELCRYPEPVLFGSVQPTHGLCSLSALKQCKCGETFCPFHGRQYDGVWYCQRCLGTVRKVGHLKWIGRTVLRALCSIKEK